MDERSERRRRSRRRERRDDDGFRERRRRRRRDRNYSSDDDSRDGGSYRRRSPSRRRLRRSASPLRRSPSPSSSEDRQSPPGGLRYRPNTASDTILRRDRSTSRSPPSLQDPKQIDRTEKNLSEEDQMAAMLGFSGFSTTKNTAIADNQQGAARGGAKKNPIRRYRQYMNRRGGFNRPLDNIS